MPREMYCRCFWCEIQIDYGSRKYSISGSLTEKDFRRLIYPDNPLITEKPVYLRNKPWYKPFSV